MRHVQFGLVVLTVGLTAACASREVPPVGVSAAPSAAGAAAKEGGKSEMPPEGALPRKPVKGSKFAKLRLGMTLEEVKSLIGPPTRQWRRPTGKASQPFYFGPDRWVIQCAYRHEGVLTFNYGEEQLLTNIEVKTDE